MGALLRIVRLAAYLAALLLVVWILLFLFDASTGNSIVHLLQQAADWLAGWTRGIFGSVTNSKLHAVVVFGLPALVYAAVGGAIGKLGSRS
ncbi:hypothetical protein ABIA32_003158 [Streptacidiphilus sp. MAP12-20]|uniref:hypothetical protein n=1 Tax=Streptacidiphilus sp. MAP12-20 TaxID=3156299 RepID=UPI0035124C2E